MLIWLTILQKQPIRATGVIIFMLLSCHVRVSEWVYSLSLPGCQGLPRNRRDIWSLTILTGKNCVLFNQYNNDWLAASDLFDMFTQSIKFYYTIHYHVLSVQMFGKCDWLNGQKVNGCSFQQVLRQNVGWFLS